MTTKQLKAEREKLLQERSKINRLSFTAMNQWFKKMNELDEKINSIAD